MWQPHINRTTEILKQSARGNKKTKNNQLKFWNSLKTSTDQNNRNEQNSETAWKHKHTKNKRNEQILKQLENINRPKHQQYLFRSLCFGLLTFSSCFNICSFLFGMLMFSSCFSICFVPFGLVCWCFQAVSEIVRSFCFWYVDVFKLFQNFCRSFCFGL